MSRVAAVVLAAGEGSRFGGPKQRLLLPSVLDRLGRSPVDETVVVAGAHPLDDLVRRPVRLVHCDNWRIGPGGSLRCGLAVLGADVDAAIVVLADGPCLAPEAIARIVSDWRDRGGPVVAASYDGVRGHPLLVERSAWGDVPAEGLRSLTARLVPCDDLGSPGDVDAPGDLPAVRDPSAGER